MSSILELQNDHLHFTVYDDCSADILDKATGKQWHMGAVTYQDRSVIANNVVWNRRERYWADYFICRFRAEKVERGILVTAMLPPWTEPHAQFLVQWDLDGKTLGLRIEDIDEKLPSLNFPPPIESASVIIPDNVGSWFRDDEPGMTCYFSTQNNGMNMRWAGGLAEDDKTGWMVIFEDDYANSGVYRDNLSLMPCWLKSKDKWNSTRSLRYHFTDNGYVGMAKTFRKYAEDTRMFRKLPEKIEETPALKNLLGGRIISFFQCHTEHLRNKENFFRPLTDEDRAEDGKVKVNITHADAAKIIQMAKDWGMERGAFNLRGTFNGGYDESHPDIWPPEPLLGSIDELKEILAQDDPYLALVHDNYQDIYDHCPTFPDGVIRNAQDELLWGGHWHGGLCYITCSKLQRQRAERNWPQLKTLGMRGHFVDTASCVQFYECYDPAHPMARHEDMPAKMDLMSFFKEQGLVLGSEEAADYGAYHIDFLENRHAHTPRTTPPLWPLVFHDATFLARYSTDGTSGGKPASQLENFLWGFMCYWPANNLASWPTQEKAFKESLALDQLHARIGIDEMTDHKYLDDGLVEQTEFSSGVSVIANFAEEPRTIDGKTIGPKGYTILD